MTLALNYPGKVRRLVVADIAPVRYTHTQAHLIDAMKSLDFKGLATRKDADRALAEFIDSREVRAFLLQSLDIREKRWALNLDTLEREVEGIVGWPDTDATFDGPALFLSGAESGYLTEDGKEAARDLFAKAASRRFPARVTGCMRRSRARSRPRSGRSWGPDDPAKSRSTSLNLRRVTSCSLDATPWSPVSPA